MLSIKVPNMEMWCSFYDIVIVRPQLSVTLSYLLSTAVHHSGHNIMIVYNLSH